jgi:hypothetical protein
MPRGRFVLTPYRGVVVRADTRYGHLPSDFAMLLTTSERTPDFSPLDFGYSSLGNYSDVELRVLRPGLLDSPKRHRLIPTDLTTASGQFP